MATRSKKKAASTKGRAAEVTMATPTPRDTKVVRAAIHPAIGIARVGDSKEEFFIGPEVTQPTPEPVGFYKDKAGALKRQAALFHVYGYNAAGEVVTELTAANAEI